MKVRDNDLQGTCGVTLLWDFEMGHNWDSYGHVHVADLNGSGGTGYAIAGFIENEICRRTYEELKAQFKIIWQSEVRMNENSDNLFFFVIYDRREPGITSVKF
jgi:hypothetical protein